MSPSNSPLRLWCLWFIAVLGGQTAATVVSQPGLGLTPLALGAFFKLPYASWFVFLLCGAAAGALVGWAQWAVLRQEIQHARWWILITTLGSAISTALNAPSHLGPYWYATLLVWVYIGMPVYGLLVGLGQWWVLRQQVARAGWWIPVQLFSSVASGFAGLYIGFRVATALDVQTPWLALFIISFIAASVYGALSGTGLVFVLAQPKSALPSSAGNPVPEAP